VPHVRVDLAGRELLDVFGTLLPGLLVGHLGARKPDERELPRQQVLSLARL
jgi:hypothetical protein